MVAALSIDNQPNVSEYCIYTLSPISVMLDIEIKVHTRQVSRCVTKCIGFREGYVLYLKCLLNIIHK
jgi:hypothetical protein